MASLAGLACGCSAFAQSDAASTQPFDVNAVRAGQPGVERVIERPDGTPAEADVPLYEVSRFLIEYRSEHPEHPSVEVVARSPVVLGVVPEGYVAPGRGVPATTVRLGDIAEATASKFSAGALTQIAKGVVSELNRLGVASVAVQLHPDDIDPQTGADRRANQRGDLRLVVWTGRVAQVRTIASGDRLESDIASGASPRINHPDGVHSRIREQSPVQPGGLMQAQQVDDYLFRLNRHPGRRVDASVAPGAAEEQIVLDYLVTENKPWSLYAQLSNTGTKQTSEWRQRIGFINNQVTGNDDIFKFDFITAALSDSFGVNASYDFPIRSDELRMKLYAGYNEFEASDVGVSGERFSGQTYSVGAEAAWTVYQQRQLFVDMIAGARFQSVKVDNEVLAEFGHERFIIPYVGARAERFTEAMSTSGAIMFEFQHPDLSNVDAVEIQRLGRSGVDDNWQLIKFDFSHSGYLEPFLSDAYWGRGEGGPTTLAHEVAFSLRGQYAFNNRVIPYEQDVAGGFFSVRGYPESVAAGDSTLIGSAEYRFHMPRFLPVSRPGMIGDRPGWFGEYLGGNFRYAPSEAFGRTDWDLIFRGFVDAGLTEISQARTGENSQSLVSVGVGVEYQFKRYVTARLDWGIALNDIDDPANGVKSGDNRFHVLLTVLY